ncbi:hypothetical protein [Klebsiella pneumoniae IS46]|nr:hypothetical protein [Klebsiella pneumoniae IS46]
MVRRFMVFLRRLRFLLGCRFRGRFVMFLMVNGSMAGCCTRVVLAASAAKATDDRPIAAATTRANTFFILKSSTWFLE